MRVSYSPSNWDLVFSNEEDSAGACNLIAYPLGKSSKFIFTREEPRIFVVVIADEMSIFHTFSFKIVGDGKTMLEKRFVGEEVSSLGTPI